MFVELSRVKPVKRRVALILSVSLNGLLIAILWQHFATEPSPMVSEEVVIPTVATPLHTATRSTASSESHSTFHWSSLESDDYTQYVANLRAIGCPENTLRDIIVADISLLFRNRSAAAVSQPEPWHSGSRRQRDERLVIQKRAELDREKRALVKELIGYEWSDDAAELWQQDSLNAVLFGFLAESKAPQLMSIVSAYSEQSRAIKDASGGILIDEDRAALAKLHDELRRDVSILLSPAEREEWELRVQALGFAALGNVYWDGVAVSGNTMREFARISRNYRDTFADEFLERHPPSESEQARRRAEFERQVESLLGPDRFAAFRRAQDQSFRDLLTFSSERQLPKDTAASVYELCRSAESKAAAFAKDDSLSSEEQAAGIALVRANTTKALATRLGSAYEAFLRGPGQWIGWLHSDSVAANSHGQP
jgi:hypothetical protein